MSHQRILGGGNMVDNDDGCGRRGGEDDIGYQSWWWVHEMVAGLKG
jgi:hypothetical protein